MVLAIAKAVALTYTTIKQLLTRGVKQFSLASWLGYLENLPPNRNAPHVTSNLTFWPYKVKINYEISLSTAMVVAGQMRLV